MEGLFIRRYLGLCQCRHHHPYLYGQPDIYPHSPNSNQYLSAYTIPTKMPTLVPTRTFTPRVVATTLILYVLLTATPFGTISDTQAALNQTAVALGTNALEPPYPVLYRDRCSGHIISPTPTQTMTPQPTPSQTISPAVPPFHLSGRGRGSACCSGCFQVWLGWSCRRLVVLPVQNPVIHFDITEKSPRSIGCGLRGRSPRKPHPIDRDVILSASENSLF